MARNDRAQWARLDIDGVGLLADLSAGVSLARPLRFEQPQLCCFGAQAARSEPLRLGHFNGRVSQGASCNASVISFAPHAHATHTECVAHLTQEPLDAWRVIPQRLLLAVLLSVAPELSADVRGDALITREALRSAWPVAPAERLTARAAVIRTLPNGADKFSSSSAPRMPPFLEAAAAQELVARGIAHLVLDVPSADRLEDGGALSAHRLFFGLAPQSTRLAEASRADCTITELAYMDDSLSDGWYLLALQSPAIDGDAVPSRPVLYRLRTG
jgi:kynurenine formamidase